MWIMIFPLDRNDCDQKSVKDYFSCESQCTVLVFSFSFFLKVTYIDHPVFESVLAWSETETG